MAHQLDVDCTTVKPWFVRSQHQRAVEENQTTKQTQFNSHSNNYLFNYPLLNNYFLIMKQINNHNQSH